MPPAACRRGVRAAPSTSECGVPLVSGSAGVYNRPAELGCSRRVSFRPARCGPRRPELSASRRVLDEAGNKEPSAQTDRETKRGVAILGTIGKEFGYVHD